MTDPERERDAPDDGSRDGDAPADGSGSDGGPAPAPDPDAAFRPDERRRLLRAVADDVRGESSESKQVAAVLYRVSDLYDPAEDTSPEEIYRNVRTIMEVKERGGLRRERDAAGSPSDTDPEGE